MSRSWTPIGIGVVGVAWVVAAWVWALRPLPTLTGLGAGLSSQPASLSSPMAAWNFPGWRDTAAVAAPAASAPSRAVLVSVFGSPGQMTAAIDRGDAQGVVYVRVGEHLDDGTVTTITPTQVEVQTADGIHRIGAAP